jgi:phosphoribosylglycinamide formyltransferase-1
MGQHAGFTVRKRTFAWYLNDHHGDGIVAIACKTALGENEEMVRREPERYYLPAYIGPKGWVGLRLDRGEVDWEEVAELVAASYCLVAPKKLAQEGLRRPPTTRLFESTDKKLGDEAELFEAREDHVRPRQPT